MFEEIDPATKASCYSVCEKPELRVDHDVTMTVKVKPSSLVRTEAAAGGPGKQYPLMSTGAVRDSNASSIVDVFNKGNGQLESSDENIHIRVLCSGDGFDADYDPKEVKIELTSEDDIFFHYVCSLVDKIEHPTGHYDSGPTGE